jgi:hypothetical protein
MGFWDNVKRGVAATATMGGSEVYRELSKDGNLLGKPQTTPTAAPDAVNFQLGGGPNSEFSNDLAANAYGDGLRNQAGQADREAGFYNQANQNFDIGNAAQMRGAPQIESALADKRAQLAALGGTNAAMGNVNQVGSQLQALGTRPMGASYAEAQLQQGLAGGMAQQLSMARSGRSLGSGQAAMNNAAFNNAALSQQTNQAAAGARIQEQNAYNQFQAGALGAAGQQYGQGGALAGQAGNQATTIRTGNEGVQAQNANLNLQQQGVNNQTTGLYNSLGAQQQGLGMQANQLGQQAQQFGQQQAGNIMGTQLQANMALGGATTAVAQANHAADDAAAAQKQNRQIELVKTGAQTGAMMSDERVKTNIMPLELPMMEPGQGGSWQPAGTHHTLGSDARAINEATATGQGNGVVGSGNASQLHEADIGPQASYLEHIRAMQDQYAPASHAPVDVLNRVPGAGAGPSAAQSSLLSFLQGSKGGPAKQQNQYAAPISEYRTGGPNGYATAAPSVTGGLVAGARPMVTSDQHSKTRIHELESQLAAIQGPPTASFAPQQPDTAALDAAYASQGGAPRPAVDLTAARGYAYDYKNPGMPGAAPGRHVGPMAQDLEHTAAAGAVHNTPHGLQVDTPRLTMVNTAALSELQRKMQKLEALGGGQAQPAPYEASPYPQTQAAY